MILLKATLNLRGVGTLRGRLRQRNTPATAALGAFVGRQRLRKESCFEARRGEGPFSLLSQSEAVSMCNSQLCDSGGSYRSVGGAESDDLIAFGARAGTLFHQ